jgi:hypothetical protein
VELALVASFVTVTLAPGTAAPVLSVTVPVIVPRSACAKAKTARQNEINKAFIAELMRVDALLNIALSSSVYVDVLKTGSVNSTNGR